MAKVHGAVVIDGKRCKGCDLCVVAWHLCNLFRCKSRANIYRKPHVAFCQRRMIKHQRVHECRTHLMCVVACPTDVLLLQPKEVNDRGYHYAYKIL